VQIPAAIRTITPDEKRSRLIIHGHSRAAPNLLPASAEHIMSVVRLLGFATLPCGCVVGRYRDVGSTREVAYIEEKGLACDSHAHRRNHTVSPIRERDAKVTNVLSASA
jgi:hypothetical protein